MPSKRQRKQWKAARNASVQTFKKRKLEPSSLNSAQLEMNNNTLNKPDTSDTEGEPGTWFGNESDSDSDSDSEDEDILMWINHI